jgi:hypothetical protein
MRRNHENNCTCVDCKKVLILTGITSIRVGDVYISVPFNQHSIEVEIQTSELGVYKTRQAFLDSFGKLTESEAQFVRELNSIAAIKAVRERTGLSLHESKVLVDNYKKNIMTQY